MVGGIRKVGLFVDWYSQLLLVPEELSTDPNLANGHALRKVGDRVAKFLCSLDQDTRYRVRIRLYHGWTAGATQTANRRAVAALPEFINPDSIFTSSRVLSLTDVEFGDRLLDALQIRENKGLQIHLPNTYRKQSKKEERTEKMVDTALAADLLSWAKSEPDSLALVLSSDDDVAPPIFVAEAWMKPHGGSVRWTRPANRGESRYLALEGILT